MKKSVFLSIILAAALLSGCVDNTHSSSEHHSSESGTSQASVTEPPAVESVPEETRHEVSALFTDYILDGMNFTITGEVPAAEPADFEYNVEDLSEYRPALNDFLTELDIPEITELCARADTLLFFFSTENLTAELNMDVSRAARLNIPSLEPSEPDHFYATDVKYDSFINAYLDVFTVEAAERVFGRYRKFRSLDGRLWLSDSAMTGDIGTVLEEYELITNTDDELAFRCMVFSTKSTDFEYHSEKRDEYDTYTLDYKFVKTDNGWRAEEFPIYSRTLDGIAP